MFKSLERAWERIKYLHRAIGFRGVAERVLRKAISPIYRRDIGVLFMSVLPVDVEIDYKAISRDDKGTSYVILRSLEELEPHVSLLHPSMPLERFRRHLAQGPGCAVVLALRPTDDGKSQRTVGFRILRQGVFTALGSPKLTHEMGPKLMMSMTAEVIPECRGQKIQFLTRAAMHEFSRSVGAIRIAGLVPPHNLPSMKVSLRSSWGARNWIAGEITRVSLFGGLIERVTAWDEIEAMLWATPPEN